MYTAAGEQGQTRADRDRVSGSAACVSAIDSLLAYLEREAG
jgi:hypothetical protein